MAISTKFHKVSSPDLVQYFTRAAGKLGQILAKMSSPELSELRVNSLEKRSEAVASLQQAHCSSIRD